MITLPDSRARCGFLGGAWLTFGLTAGEGEEELARVWPSLRLRFTGIVGDGPTLSAIAFDSHTTVPGS